MKKGLTFKQIKEKLKGKRVGIAGAGGLGSNCAVALARIGIENLVIADFDIVSEGNLNRQYFFYEQIGEKKVVALKENIRRINKEINVDAYDLKLKPDDILRVFKDCDVIVEAFDLAKMKQMILETVLDKMPETPIVTGLGMAGWGNNESIHYRKEGMLHICGDEKTEIAEDIPPLAPRVGMVANMQANTVLEILLK
ncbi:MAG: sulfur carrier protein ThiS adenylyltransferase ThiF [Bacteroidetes bacterium]|nr:MAG: sulfur carrier protein ThiS adenylyltransferase ThiF [Bacteroidota bacterium]